MIAAAPLRATSSASLGFPASVTRAAPPKRDPHQIRVLGWLRHPIRPQQLGLAPGHPARHATDLTAGLLACGSPPVTAFPGSTPVALWHELAAYSCGGSCGIGTSIPHRIPFFA